MFAKFRVAVVAFASLGGLIAQPALANSASADIASTLRTSDAAKPSGSGDEEFSRLFSSWKSPDQGKAPPAGTIVGMPGTHASIPSLMPVADIAMTSAFGMREHPILGGLRMHKGVDLAAPMGTPVHAAADGVVERADWFSGYGLYVALEHGDNIETRYGHMSRLNVAAGQYVHKGDIIGYVGATGRATGPHLHYEVRINGKAVNPLPYIEGGAVDDAAVTTLAQR